jgi:hypothetical protein
LSNGQADENDNSPLLLLEEDGGSPDDGASGGLELDARQAAEIRQIFLTTLPDYLEPIKEMVARLSSEPDEDGKIRGSLAKTIASIGEAAARVSVDDVTRTMETLRDDVLLIGDPSEPQEPLREKIAAALASLARLSGGMTSGRPQKRSETIVSAFRDVEGIDGSVVNRLVSAGVVYVDQLLDADPKDVALVSGLDKETVAKILRALEPKRAPSSLPNQDGPHSADAGNILDLLDAKSSLPPPKPSPPRDGARARSGDARTQKGAFTKDPRGHEEKEGAGNQVRTLVESELALEEARGEATRLRIVLDALRTNATALERQCAAMRSTIADVKQQVALRVAALGKAEAKKSVLEREHVATLADLERIAARLVVLETERRAALDELQLLADDTAGLAQHVTGVLDSHSRS